MRSIINTSDFLHLLYRAGLTLLLVPALAWATLPTDSEYLVDFESAVAEFDTKDYSSAEIHLKNALKKKPDHLPSRLLLGRTHLKLGRAPEAEKELLIALRRGAAKDRVVIPLGNALLLQRKYSDILDRITIEGISHAGRYEVLTLRGRAHREMGDLKSAHRSFDQAIAYNDKLVEAYLGKSRAFSAAGEYVKAESWLNIALERDPASSELLFEKANLRRRQGDNDSAEELYTRVLTATPGHMRARLGRASLNLSLGELEQARQDSEYVHLRVPRDPDAALLYAQALSGLGQSDEAREVLHNASASLSRIDEKEIVQQPGLLRIAALISLKQGAIDRANLYLDRYVDLVPHEVRIRVISARVKLQLDDMEGALRVLEPVYKSGAQDAELFSLMGEAYLASERFDEAQVALEKAARLQPDSSLVNTRLALSKIGSGETEGAWQDLLTAHSNSEGASVAAGIIMAIMLVRDNDNDQALSIAEELLERQPKNPVLHNLIGAVHLSRSELSQAKDAFEQALAMDPAFIPAMYNLGIMELEAENPDGAGRWFNRIVQLDSQQPRALVGLAEINISQGNYENAISLLSKATVSKSDNVDAHMRLIEILLLTGDIPEAQREGSVLAGRHWVNAQVLELLAQVEIAAGNRQNAVSYLRNASRNTVNDGVMQIRIAEQLIELKDYETARTPLVLALSTEQKMVAQDMLVQLYLREGDTKSARNQASQVRKEYPESALGYMLEARILQSEENYEGAILQYQKAIEIQENRDVILNLYALYDGLGRQQDGFVLMEEWIQGHPHDSIAQRILSLGYLRAGRRSDARTILETLVESRPNDSLVLATLAQLYLQDGNPNARALAGRALQAAPNWAIALDTYGWVLVRAGEAAEGLKYLREAISRDSNPLIRYHLAAALHDLGRESEALTELDIIMRLSPEPAWVDSARELYELIEKSG